MGKSTALATQDVGELAKPRITKSAAVDMVRKMAADLLRAAKNEQREVRRQIEISVGGHTKRVDDSVVNQAEALMTRLALIAKGNNEDRFTAATQLEGIVKKMGGIVGELKAFMLTNRAVGLFEQVDEHAYTGYSYGGRGASKNPLDHVGKKTRAAAIELLEQYEIVDEPKGRGKNAAEPGVVSVAQLADEAGDDGLDDTTEDDEEEAQP